MAFPRGHKINTGRKHGLETRIKRGNIWRGKKRPPFSEEWKKNMSLARKGKPGHKHTEETRRRLSLVHTGKKMSEESKKKMSIARMGKTHSEEYKRKMSEGHKKRGLRPPGLSGAAHYNWKGGIEPNPYPKEFNRELKLKIRTKNGFMCVLCGKTEREELEEIGQVLSVNHIDFDKNNCKESNLNTLCLRCNIKINRERNYWTNYFNLI